MVRREQRATGRISTLNVGIASVLLISDDLGGHRFKHRLFDFWSFDIVKRYIDGGMDDHSFAFADRQGCLAGLTPDQ
jgi:hypothetical protein